MKQDIQDTKKTQSVDEATESKSASAQEHNELEQQLASCQSDLQEWKDKYLHIVADFQNYKKRAAKDLEHMHHAVQAEVFSGILDLVDNFDRALGERDEKDIPEQAKSWLEGFVLIHKDLNKFLEKSGITEIKTDKGFDPELHEAVARVSSDKHESGDIVEVVHKGYMLNNRVLRPVKVVVAH